MLVLFKSGFDLKLNSILVGSVDSRYAMVALLAGSAAVVRRASNDDLPRFTNDNYYLSLAALWITRLVAINAAFMYHCVLSLVPLTWVLHSAKGGTAFQKWTEFVYLPL